MLTMAALFFILAAVAAFMTALSHFLAKKSTDSREKLSPFECGFEPKGSKTAKIPLSLRFFSIALMFLIFDIEVALIIPVAPGLRESSGFFGLAALLFILWAGTVAEWASSSLDWKN